MEARTATATGAPGSGTVQVGSSDVRSMRISELGSWVATKTPPRSRSIASATMPPATVVFLSVRSARIDDLEPALAGLGDGDPRVAAVGGEQVARAGELGAFSHGAAVNDGEGEGPAASASRRRGPPGRERQRRNRARHR